MLRHMDSPTANLPASPRPRRLEHPSRDEIASLPLFPALTRDRVLWVASGAAADAAMTALDAAHVVGFDTESKPTFVAGAPRTGPHLVQFAAHDLGFCVPTESTWGRRVLERLIESEDILKVGFGIPNDRKPLASQFGLKLRASLDLAPLVKRLGYRQRVGLQAAVAIVLGQRLAKSKSTQTSNWAARPLTDRQLVYAANDAYASLLVYQSLLARHPDWFSAASI